MISRYVAHALERAQYRLLPDGTFAATVRGLRGVIATGATLEACRRDLAEVVEEWLLVRVARGLSIPALDGATIRVRRAS
jgi:predicted RNase H-like HicB family nuclease